MASSAEVGTPRYEKKKETQRQKRLAKHINSGRKKTFVAAIVKKVKASVMAECNKKLELAINKSNCHFRNATTWRTEAKGLQKTNNRLEHKLGFAVRRLKEKDEQIVTLQTYINRLRQNRLIPRSRRSR